MVSIKSNMHVEQAKKIDDLGDSNVHGSNPINVRHAAYEEKKDANPWPMTEIASKLLNIQGEGAHVDCTNSLDLVMDMSIQLKRILVKPIQINMSQSLQLIKTTATQSMCYLVLMVKSVILILVVTILISCLQGNIVLNVVLLFPSLFLLRLNHLLLLLVWKTPLRISLHMHLT